ncbi:MAG: hypothetical protein CVU55_02715 [Deltaproteobacteria bacterium HGW-Deltaproteobacteria-13]|nr:MAG: hypothetical protein CVU55_02715 [Deltaproteobacteria bacterium HGW-Deltaproteobacteria-13]
MGITVNGAIVTLGAITLGQPSISAYGTSSVNVPVLIDGLAATVPISVTFASSCVTSGKATLTSPVTNNIGTGIATSTYKDNNCNSGTDVITASVSGGAHASATITVIPPATNNIQFVSATPSIIGTSTASSSSLPTSSLVKFRVVDSSNNGKSGVGVTFSVIPNSYASLGISFTPESATSDADGYVTTALSSGTIPTPVWVVATVDGTSLKSQSNTLTITTGLPTQDFFSLSVQTYNIEGWNYDGTKSNLMIIASDRLGNPVPDGTAINFITEGAQITPASCTTSAGTCSVIFTSAESRPADGRVTLLAYAIGEKSFVDTTINNSYDSGETFYDIGDPYIDANENGVWDSGEFTIPSTTSGSLPCRTQPGNTALPSSYGRFPNGWSNYVPSAPSKENTCTGTWGQNYVRRSVVVVLSGSKAYISPSTVDMASTCSQTFPLILTDVNGNPMPAGTTIAVSSSNVNYIANGATSQSAASSSIPGGTPVINTNHAGGTIFGLTVQADCSAGFPVSYPTGSLYLDVTTPNGIGTTIPVTVISTP